MGYSRTGSFDLSEPPDEFGKEASIGDASEQMMHRPHQEIQLITLPKSVKAGAGNSQQVDFQTIEAVVTAFAGLVLQSGEAALRDSESLQQLI
jgi:hypothetical protein